MSTADPPPVCRRLRDERQRLGLSQEAAATAAGASISTLKRWEKDTPIPTDRLDALAHRGIDALYVVTGVRAPDAAVRDDGGVYRMPPDQRALHVMGTVLDVQEEMGLSLSKEQFKTLVGYAYEHAPTKAGLRAFVEAALAMANPGKK